MTNLRGCFQEENLTQGIYGRKLKRVREIESEGGCLIIDDTIIEKQWTKENEIVCWHYNHSKGRNVIERRNVVQKKGRMR